MLRSIAALTLSIITLFHAPSTCADDFDFREEGHVDFKIDAAAIKKGDVQFSLEWLTPSEYESRDVRVSDDLLTRKDFQGNQINAGKIVFISKKPITEFSVANLSDPAFVKHMMSSVSVTKTGDSTFDMVNKSRAYGLNFKVGYRMKITDHDRSVPSAVASFFRNQASPFAGTGKERFITLNMDKFDQLMLRNYSWIYFKELTDGRTLIVSTMTANIDLKKANRLFQYPPLSRAEDQILNNTRRQYRHMAENIR